MNITAFLHYLNETKHLGLDTGYYSYIETWRQWWHGDVPAVHNRQYEAPDGSKKTRKRASLRMPKRVCEDWANLLLNDRTTGQWMAANGVIYRLLADSIAAKDGRFFWPADRRLIPWRVRIGVDFGGNGSKHAFVATAILPGYAGVVGLASQRVDPVAQDADFLADQLLLFCMAVFARWGEIQYIFCDSAEQTLIHHIKARLRRSRLAWLADRVENSAKIRINDRIRLTCILMGGGRFWLMPEAATLRDALATALYSGKHPGIDERLDDGSTDIDTLDAYEYTIERDFKRLTNT